MKTGMAGYKLGGSVSYKSGVAWMKINGIRNMLWKFSVMFGNCKFVEMKIG